MNTFPITIPIKKCLAWATIFPVGIWVKEYWDHVSKFLRKKTIEKKGSIVSMLKKSFLLRTFSRIMFSWTTNNIGVFLWIISLIFKCGKSNSIKFTSSWRSWTWEIFNPMQAKIKSPLITKILDNFASGSLKCFKLYMIKVLSTETWNQKISCLPINKD